MLRLIKSIKPFAPYVLIAWMITIIVVSSTPNLPVLKIHTQKSDIRLDYFIHFCEYAMLAFLTYLTFTPKNFRVNSRRFIILTSGLILFAIADEFHQKMVPGRTFNPRDLLGNFAGIAFALLFCIVVFRKIKNEVA